MTGPTGLVQRVSEHLADLAPDLIDRGDLVVIGVSGGLDSMALVHLFAHGLGMGNRVVPVHVDHRMRAESETDAQWVRSTLATWRLDCVVRTLDKPPTTEAEARDQRYSVLEQVRREVGASWVLTAHTADDQAETVLFRAARGAGVRGLRGIRPVRGDTILRPLLPFWRSELEAYSKRAEIPWREDPSNQDVRFSRNRIRHQILPELEATVPGARRSLAQLADTARETQAGLEALANATLEQMTEKGFPGSDLGSQRRSAGSGGTGETVTPVHWVLSRQALRALPDEALALVCRQLARVLGIPLGRGATQNLIDMVRRAKSGTTMELSEGLALERQFDSIVIRDRRQPGASPGGQVDEVVVEQGVGAAVLVVGGGRFHVTWGPEQDGRDWVAGFPEDAVSWPLVVRPWKPGDRARTKAGTKKVKKLLGEARIPVHLRTKTVVVLDASGDVLWIPGISASVVDCPRDEANPVYLMIRGETEPA